MGKWLRCETDNLPEFSAEGIWSSSYTPLCRGGLGTRCICYDRCGYLGVCTRSPINLREHEHINLKTTFCTSSSIFWDITSCSKLKINRRFRGTCCLQLRDRRIRQARNQHEAGSKQSQTMLVTCFLTELFFDPEDGGDMFL
jgi:hypothetical protein